MKRFIAGEDRRQATLLPDCLDDYVTADNPVRLVEVFVDELDLTALGFAGAVPEATGRPAYHPATLLKIYLYGYLNRIPSSRRLERETQRNIELIWLTGRLMPDFKTLADFRKDNGPAIQAACAQFVVLCRRLNLFGKAVVAIDGSKFKAVNNRDKNFTAAKVEARVAQVEASNYICPQPLCSAQPGRTRAIVFNEGLGYLRLRDVTARSVGAFRDELRAAGVSVPTVRKILGTLQLILGHAVSLDLLAVNVARGVKVIGRRDEGSRRIVPPSKEALRQLLAAADPDFRIRLIVASATGVRAGELHALRWRHVDLKRAELTVETRVDAYRDEDVTKTAAGMRMIPLGAAVVAALREWHRRSAHPGADDLMFPNRCGGYEGHDNMVKRRFLPLFRKLTEWHAADPASRPLPPARFNWHALRHFAVSCWIEAGLSPKTVQVFAGHASLQVTMDRYGHLFKNDDHRRAMDTMAHDLTS